MASNLSLQFKLVHNMIIIMNMLGSTPFVCLYFHLLLPLKNTHTHTHTYAHTCTLDVTNKEDTDWDLIDKTNSVPLGDNNWDLKDDKTSSVPLDDNNWDLKDDNAVPLSTNSEDNDWDLKDNDTNVPSSLPVSLSISEGVFT